MRTGSGGYLAKRIDGIRGQFEVKIEVIHKVEFGKERIPSARAVHMGRGHCCCRGCGYFRLVLGSRLGIGWFREAVW